MDSRFTVFEDYFGLSNIAWGHKQALDDLMGPRCVTGFSSELIGLHSVEANSDDLDQMRTNAHEEFLNNGVSKDMDEVDQYQLELRKRTSSRPTVVQESQNKMLTEYLETKSKRKLKKLKKFCVFCKNNNEPGHIYTSHILKDLNGRITCPVLRKYTCPLCGASGDRAHTIRYCSVKSQAKPPVQPCL